MNKSQEPAVRKRVDWVRIGSYAGGAVSVLLLLGLQVWRAGAIAVVLFTFLCAGIGAAVGAGIQYLAGRRRS